MKLICPFTFSVSEFNLVEPRLERVKFLMRKFYSLNSKFHKIKLVTDIKSHTILDFIKFDEVEYIDTEFFNYVDDFKIYLLQRLQKEEIIIDFDVYLQKPLIIDLNYDLVIERYEERSAEKVYKALINDCRVVFDKSYFNKIRNLDKVPNIGILKINNSELLKKYTTLYTKMSIQFRDKATIQDVPYNQYSVLFGQLLLRKILNEESYSSYSCKENTLNKYIHFSGNNKFLMNQVDIERILYKTEILE